MGVHACMICITSGVPADQVVLLMYGLGDARKGKRFLSSTADIGEAGATGAYGGQRKGRRKISAYRSDGRNVEGVGSGPGGSIALSEA